MRLPADLVSECLRMAQIQSLPDPGTDPQRRLPEASIVERLEAGRIMAGGRVDLVAAELLDVVNQASLMVTADLRYGTDTSVPTVWATPRRAVVSSSLDPEYVEFRPVQVTQLPQVLSELIVLRSPRFIGDVPISISTSALSKAKTQLDHQDAAVEVLIKGGLDAEQAVLVTEIQRDPARRWTITSTWSTEEGQEMAELRGVDAGDSGQWLIATTDGEDGGQTTFTPQGHGEVMSAFRSVLPRNWLGTPLNRPPT